MNRSVVTVFVLTLGACAPVLNDQDQALTVADNFPITVNEDMASLTVNPGGRSGSLSAYDKAQIASFVSEYKMRGHGPMMFAVSSTTGSRTGTEVRNALQDSGIEGGEIQDVSYNAAAANASAPVVLTFTRYVASTIECGTWTKDLANTGRNMPWSNFGCATQNNIAAMVLDPQDLVEPRGMDASDSERRAVVLDKYKQGMPTEAVTSDQNAGNVSDAVQQ